MTKNNTASTFSLGLGDATHSPEISIGKAPLSDTDEVLISMNQYTMMIRSALSLVLVRCSKIAEMEPVEQQYEPEPFNEADPLMTRIRVINQRLFSIDSDLKRIEEHLPKYI